jgi:hypothetical protein
LDQKLFFTARASMSKKEVILGQGEVLIRGLSSLAFEGFYEGKITGFFGQV